MGQDAAETGKRALEALQLVADHGKPELSIMFEIAVGADQNFIHLGNNGRNHSFNASVFPPGQQAFIGAARSSSPPAGQNYRAAFHQGIIARWVRWFIQ